MARIFISTSSRDADFARGLAERLRGEGHEAWFYGDTRAPGTWDRDVEQALAAAAVTLVVLSPDSGVSENVRDEIIRARELDQEIVPIVARSLAPEAIPLPIVRQVRLNFAADYEGGFAQLLSMLRRAEEHRRSREEQSRRDPEGQERRIAGELEASRRVLEARRTAGQPPYDPTGVFRDRTEIVARIVQTLSEDRYRLVTVIGRGGIGKTAAACRGLDELSVSRLELDGILYMSTRTRGISMDLLVDELCAVVAPAEAGAMRRAWARPKVPLRERALEVLEFLRGGRYLVLLDNLEDLLDTSGRFRDRELQEFLTTSLTTSSQVRYLATSRVPVALAEGYAVRIDITDGLPREEAVAVLRELDSEGYLEGEDEAVLADVVERLHGVPHALELVVGRLAQDPFATLRDVVGDGGDEQGLVPDLVAHMYRDLTPEARRVMQALAVFGRPVPQLAVEYVVRELEPGLDTPAVLRWLAGAHFVTVNRQAKTVTLHPLDRDFIYDDLPAAGELSRARLHRICAGFYATQKTPIDKTPDGLLLNTDPFLLEFEHLVAAGELDRAALELRRFGVWLTWHGSPGRVEQLLETLEDGLEDPRARLAYHLCQTANATVLGERDRGLRHGTEALRLAAELGDRNEEAYACRRLALVHRYSGETAKAIELFERAFDLNQEIGVLRHQAMLLAEIGFTHGYDGDAERCLEAARRSLEAAQQAGDPTVTAYAHSGLALGHYLRGDGAAALAAGEKLLGLRDHAPGEVAGYTLQVMGLVRATSGEPGDLDLALAHLEEARSIGRRQGHHRLEAYTCHNLAVLAYLAGDDGRAAELAARARQLFTPLRIEGASAALTEAAAARRDGDPKREAEALIECARHSTASPDFYPSRRLAEVARERAAGVGLMDLAAEAERLRDGASPPEEGT